MPTATPTASGLAQRLGDFAVLPDALDHAARGATGLNFYAARGSLDAVLPYAELREAALRLARRLLGAGLARGDRVGLVAATDPDFARAFMACQYAGLIPAPLPLPAAFGGRDAYVAHVGRLAREARAAAVLAPAAIAAWLAPLAGPLGLRLCGTAADLDAAPEHGGPLRPAGPDGVAYLQFSSGSTRFPRGVAVRQRALMNNLAAILQHGLRVQPDDRAVSWLPLYHDMGLVGFLLAPLAGQVSLDLIATADFARRPLLWLQLLSDNRGTLSYGPGFGYDLCVRRARSPAGGALGGVVPRVVPRVVPGGVAPGGASGGAPAALDLRAWRAAGVGGDMIRPGVLRAFADAFAPAGFRASSFVPSYGMAEATLAISFAPLGAGARTDAVDLDRLERDGQAAAPGPSARAREFVLCGPPLPGQEVEVRGDDGAPLPERRVGRILVRGPNLMDGYDGRPDETAAALSPDKWLDTGDLGYLLDGQIVVTGRAKDLIIVNGRNIWPQDLEWSVERAVPAVRTGDVAAFSVDEDGEAVVVLVEARGAPDPAARERLAAEVAGAVRAGHGVEARVVPVPPGGLPHTSSGKLSRALARRHYLEGRFGAHPARSAAAG